MSEANHSNAPNVFVLRMEIEGVDKVGYGLETDRIVIGYAKAPADLIDIASKSDSHTALRDVVEKHFEGNKSVAGRKASDLRTFLHVMQLGDFVLVLREGFGVYLATVAGPPSFDPSRVDDDTAYHREVDWLNDKEPISGDVRHYMARGLTCAKANPKDAARVRQRIADGEFRESSTDALNTILYGPPGTGKTYLTARRCVEICKGYAPKDDDKIRERYRQLVKEKRVEFVTFHESYGYEEFVEGLRPAPNKDGQAGFRLKPKAGVLKRIAKRARKYPENAYVLVIDEINRANVSKVMGELITLLEEDKREGEDNEVAVTLPHSRKPFRLPENVHVLGTMNTADRSIALIDTALRRRFRFEEMAPEPNPELLGAVDGVDLASVLTAINDRLEYLLDRDHLIGHAWLMKATTKAEVDDVMRHKIIPLLAEYFHDDWRKVQAALGGGEDFVCREPLQPTPGLGDDEVDERYRWTVQSCFAEGAYQRLIKGQQT